MQAISRAKAPPSECPPAPHMIRNDTLHEDNRHSWCLMTQRWCHGTVPKVTCCLLVLASDKNGLKSVKSCCAMPPIPVTHHSIVGGAWKATSQYDNLSYQSEGIAPLWETNISRGCVNSPSNVAGQNFIISCHSRVLNSPVRHTCIAILMKLHHAYSATCNSNSWSVLQPSGTHHAAHHDNAPCS